MISSLEKAFVATWIALQQAVTEDQQAKRDATYRREFANIPHPVLGANALHPPFRELTATG